MEVCKMAQKKQTVKGKSQSSGNNVMSKTSKSTSTNKNKTTNTKEKKELIVTNHKKQLDPKTMEIIAALGVLLLIISYFTMGLFTTIVLILGVLSIIGLSHLLKKVSKNSKKRKVLNIVVIVFLGLCILGSVAAGGFFVYIVQSAQDKFNPEELNNKQSSILYDNAGNEIAKMGAELRENIKYDDLPQVFVDALIATEDSRFYQHNGFDAPRFIKASLGQLAGQDAGGASTLTMQVAKNSFTSEVAKGIPGIVRKFTDIYLAVFKLEKNYTKEQIIEFYVNNHTLGGVIFGVEEASKSYFGKSVKDLNLAEASLLAGMFQAPSSYNPITNPEKATARRRTVLNLMVRHGYISQEEADIANAIPVESLVAGASSSKLFEHQAYIDVVLDELNEKYGISYSQTPVLVYTNMDAAKQSGINAIFNGETFTWANDKVQSGVAVVENATGKLVAVGAGRNRQTQRGLNYADRRRQIGSTAKPIFDYGPGMEYNNWSTYQQFVDEPWSYTNGPSVNNSDGKFMGQISLRTALSLSRNIPALKAFQSVDNKKINQFVTSLGITPESSNGYLHEAHSLGAFPGASAIEMAGAYAAFGNGGYYTEPYTISKIVFRDTGEEITAKDIEKKQVMSDSTAFMITDVLKTAVNSGLSSGAKIPGVNLAAKTGTSSFDDETKKAYNLPANAINDAWIVGYDPEYAVSMWYGYDNIKDGYNTDVQAVVQRGKLYRALGNVVFKKNNQDFKVPNSVVKSPVEIGSDPALLPSDQTPSDQIVYEYFKAGTEPTETSTKYKKLDSVTNLTAKYDEDKEEVTLKWTGIPTPGGNESYGEFGYNVYFNNTLLGFTTDTKYVLKTSDPNGTYKVVSTFKNYSGNQSNPTTVTLEVDEPEVTPKPTPSGKYKVSLNGQQYITVAVGGKFVDSNPPISIIDTNTQEEIADRVIADGGLKTTIKDENGEVVNKISTEKPTVYTITYEINYNGYKSTLKRTVSVK